jgi:polysaccharide export outer membrane protein
MSPTRLTLPILALAASAALFGQTFGSVPSQTTQTDPAQVLAGNLGSDPVGAGDLIYLSVTGSPELTRSYRIAEDGQISIPMLKQGIPVAGMTPDQINQVVTRTLTEKRILREPIVFVEVLEYRSRLVSVVGAVKNPTMVQAVNGTRLLDAIARAQGLAPEAGGEIVITRKLPGKTESETVHIPAKSLFAGTDPSLNLALHGGEVVQVPEASKLYIMGNVKQPGVFPITDLEGSSVMKALALSQGTLSFSSKDAYVYRLTEGARERREIKVELAKIIHRKAPDFPLQANDLLYIPENTGRKLSASVLQTFSGVGASTASGLIIWH